MISATTQETVSWKQIFTAVYCAFHISAGYVCYKFKIAIVELFAIQLQIQIGFWSKKRIFDDLPHP